MINPVEYNIVKEIVSSGSSLDTVIFNLTENKVKLNDSQIKECCNLYFSSGKKDETRLRETDKLFQQLHKL